MKTKLLFTITIILIASTIHTNSLAEVPSKHRSSFKKVQSAIKICAMFSVNKRLNTAERNLKKYYKYKTKALNKFPKAIYQDLSIQYFTPENNNPEKTKKSVSDWLKLCDENMPSHIALLKSENAVKIAEKEIKRKKDALKSALAGVTSQLNQTLENCASINAGLMGSNLFNILNSYIANRDSLLSNRNYSKIEEQDSKYTIMVTPAKKETLIKTTEKWLDYCDIQLDRMKGLIEDAKAVQKANPYH